MSLSTALICVQFLSVKQAAARAQIAGAIDIGLYSLFAQYDKCLLENYDLFYFDAGFGRDELQMGKVLEIVQQYMEPVLEQNQGGMQYKTGGFTGYELATDQQGASFYEQAVSAEKSSLAEGGIQLLISKVKGESAEIEKQEEMREERDRDAILAEYEQEVENKAQEAERAEETGEFQNEAEGTSEMIAIEENPIDVIRRIQKMGILELVLEHPEQVSKLAVNSETLLSHREKQTGMSMYRETEETNLTNCILFQEYLLDKCGNYLNPGTGGLAYQTEYILAGKEEDVENLRQVANQLLLIREGANLIYLYSDREKYAQARLLAGSIAAAFLLPVAEPLICLALLACWAFAESVLDVRELLSGGKIKLMKDKEGWQLSLENLPRILENLDSSRKSQEDGLSYKDYLRLLLFTKGQETKLNRGMDMVETGVRGQEGKESFSLDCCLYGIEVETDIQTQDGKLFTAGRAYAYE